jgi:hypothetical protein
LGLLVYAFVVYAIYRYGVIPAIRNQRSDPVFIEMRSHGGWEYRFSVIARFIGAALALAAGALFMAGLVWQAGVAFVVGIAIITIANYHRFTMLRRYRGW